MDLLLEIADTYLLDDIYTKLVPLGLSQTVLNGPIEANITSPSSILSNAWPRSYLPRQILSLSIISLLGSHILYFLFASISYYSIFNHKMMLHPRFLPNQIKLEIQTSLKAFPVMMLLTLPWFLGEVRGFSKLYGGDPSNHWGGWWYLVGSIPAYLVFTDYCIYWIHRWLHHPLLYKTLHKPHHRWISWVPSSFYVRARNVLSDAWYPNGYLVPTPFASYAFHPLDGYLQSIPYHLFVFLFPMHRYLYIGFFIAVMFWTILVRVPGSMSVSINTHFVLFFFVFATYVDSWLRHDHRPSSRKNHKRTSTPYIAPHVFYGQLRTILHLGRSCRKLLSSPWTVAWPITRNQHRHQYREEGRKTKNGLVPKSRKHVHGIVDDLLVAFARGDY